MTLVNNFKKLLRVGDESFFRRNFISFRAHFNYNITITITATITIPLLNFAQFLNFISRKNWKLNEHYRYQAMLWPIQRLTNIYCSVRL